MGDTRFNEIMKRDSYLDQSMINAINVVQQKSIQVTVSFLTHKNKIQSTLDYKTARFFGFESEKELKMNNNILQFMPKIIADNHDGIIQNYVNETSNKIQTNKQTKSLFIVNKDGFMVPCTFYIDIVFP